MFIFFMSTHSLCIKTVLSHSVMKQCLLLSNTAPSLCLDCILYFAWADQRHRVSIKCKGTICIKNTVMKLICYCFCSTHIPKGDNWILHGSITLNSYVAIAGYECSHACAFFNGNGNLCMCLSSSASCSTLPLAKISAKPNPHHKFYNQAPALLLASLLANGCVIKPLVSNQRPYIWA